MIRTLLFLACLATPAWALELVVDAAVGFRHVNEIDLAALGESGEFGSANDASPGQLGFFFAAGVRPVDFLEVQISAGIAIVGLALGHVEERYFDSDEAAIGSSLAVEAGGAAMWSHDLADRWTVLVGPSAAAHAMSAASPVGSARVSSLRLGAAGAVRYAIAPNAKRVWGHLQLWTDYSLHLPQHVDVGSGDTAKIENSDPSGNFTTLAFLLGYGMTFR